MRDVDLGAMEIKRMGEGNEIGSERGKASRFGEDGVEQSGLLGRGESVLASAVEGICDGFEGIAKLIGDGGGETADDGEFFLGEEVLAGAAELFEAVGKEEFLAVQILHEKPGDEAEDGIDEGDGTGFNVFVGLNDSAMEAEILKDPEEIQKVGKGHDQDGAAQGVVEGGLKDGEAHEDVILAVTAVGGGGSDGHHGIDEDGDGGDGVEGW